MKFKIQLRDGYNVIQDCYECNTLSEYIVKIEQAKEQGSFVILDSLNGTDVAVNINNILYVNYAN